MEGGGGVVGLRGSRGWGENGEGGGTWGGGGGGGGERGGGRGEVIGRRTSRIRW